MNDNNVTDPIQPQEPSPQESQSSQNTTNGMSKKKNVLIIAGLILLISAVGLGAYFLGARVSNKTESPSAQTSIVQVSPTAQVTQPSIVGIAPKSVAFMRNGEIWFTNFATNKTAKMSKATKVESPKLSPNGKYAVYFEIVHAGGGFPTGSVYLADT